MIPLLPLDIYNKFPLLVRLDVGGFLSRFLHKYTVMNAINAKIDVPL